MLKLGLPSKGRLMDKAASWFAGRGITLSLAGGGREYAADLGFPGVEPVLLPAGEIPRELGAGSIHLGITGMDVVQERLVGWDAQVKELAPLGFGQATLLIAVPDFWHDVRTMHDLDIAAAAFRATHGQRLRIATKYHRLTREFLRAEGVADYRLTDSQGATEGTIRNLAAEAISDITSTGETLRANHLRPIEDGVILRSEAALFKSRAAPWSDETRATMDAFAGALGIAS